MSDILVGLRSYPLFMYSQVWNLGQPYFSPPSFSLQLTALVQGDSEWKISSSSGGFGWLFSEAIIYWLVKKHSRHRRVFYCDLLYRHEYAASQASDGHAVSEVRLLSDYHWIPECMWASINNVPHNFVELPSKWPHCKTTRAFLKRTKKGEETRRTGWLEAVCMRKCRTMK